MTLFLDCVSLSRPSLCRELCRLTSFLRRCLHRCVRNDQSHELCHSPTDLSKQNGRNGKNQKKNEASQKSAKFPKFPNKLRRHKVRNKCATWFNMSAHFLQTSRTAHKIHKICIEQNTISRYIEHVLSSGLHIEHHRATPDTAFHRGITEKKHEKHKKMKGFHRFSMVSPKKKSAAPVQPQPPGSASLAHATNPPMAAPNVATRPYASGLPGRRRI